MERRQLTKSEALKLINEDVTVKYDTIDGYATIKKKPKGLFEMKVYTTEPFGSSSFNGDFKNLMKTLNSLDNLYINESE